MPFPLIAAIAPVIGSVVGGIFGKKGVKAQNEAQIASAREQMDFQRESQRIEMEFGERMANTAHQRQVADLRAAGLNPILAAQSGAPSPNISAPSGAQASIQDEMGPAISSALAVREMAQLIKNREQEFKLLRHQTQKASAEANSASSAAIIAQNEAEASRLIPALTRMDLDRQAEHLKVERAAATGAGIEQDIDQSALGVITRYFNRVFGAGGSARGIMQLAPGAGVLRRK